MTCTCDLCQPKAKAPSSHAAEQENLVQELLDALEAEPDLEDLTITKENAFIVQVLVAAGAHLVGANGKQSNSKEREAHVSASDGLVTLAISYAG